MNIKKYQDFGFICQDDYIYTLHEMHEIDENQTDAVACMIMMYILIEKYYNETIKNGDIKEATKMCLNGAFYLHVIWGILFQDIQLMFNKMTMLEVNEDDLNISKNDYKITKDLFNVSRILEDYIYESDTNQIKDDFSQIMKKIWNILEDYMDNDYKYNIGKSPRDFELLLNALKNKLKDKKPIE
ncbi:MAG: hypothetical protein IKR57_01170 [Bacilli bacterium]|nr:hypothetical protein [Bacilli bacterium]